MVSANIRMFRLHFYNPGVCANQFFARHTRFAGAGPSSTTTSCRRSCCHRWCSCNTGIKNQAGRRSAHVLALPSAIPSLMSSNTSSSVSSCGILWRRCDYGTDLKQSFHVKILGVRNYLRGKGRRVMANTKLEKEFCVTALIKIFQLNYMQLSGVNFSSVAADSEYRIYYRIIFPALLRPKYEQAMVYFPAVFCQCRPAVMFVVKLGNLKFPCCLHLNGP